MNSCPVHVWGDDFDRGKFPASRISVERFGHFASHAPLHAAFAQGPSAYGHNYTFNTFLLSYTV